MLTYYTPASPSPPQLPLPSLVRSPRPRPRRRQLHPVQPLPQPQPPLLHQPLSLSLESTSRAHFTAVELTTLSTPSSGPVFPQSPSFQDSFMPTASLAPSPAPGPRGPVPSQWRRTLGWTSVTWLLGSRLGVRTLLRSRVRIRGTSTWRRGISMWLSNGWFCVWIYNILYNNI